MIRKMILRQSPYFFMTAIVYLVVLCVMITLTNQNVAIQYKLEPYIFGSDSVDLFYTLFITIPFSWNLYYLKKDGFLHCIGTRISERKYITIQMIVSTFLCMTMVFFVNMIAIIYSIGTAQLVQEKSYTLDGYFLAQLQMEQPMVFGIFWSIYKSIIAGIICMIAQIIAIHVSNIFIALLAPFFYILLENFVTSLLHIPQYSFMTLNVLNRLAPFSTKYYQILILFLFYSLVGVILYIYGVRKNEQFYT